MGTEGPYAHAYSYDKRGNLTLRDGWGGEGTPYASTYAANNQRNGYSYDAAGNTTSDGWTSYAYDAEGRQVSTSYSGYTLTQAYDGDRLRVKKAEQGAPTYYLRSSALGGQIVAELNGAGTWVRGYVYDWSGALLAVQQDGAVSWSHSDPVAKSRRIVSASGTTTTTVELDSWGASTSRTVNSGQQPRLFTSYLRDGVGSDDAQHRRYNRYYARFEQPDPSNSSYDLSDPQSFNRYAYTQNDPVNFVDPSGLNAESGGGNDCWFMWTATGWFDGNNLVNVTNFSGRKVCYGGGGNGGSLGGGSGGGGTDRVGILPNAPCTPTGEQLAKNPQVQKALNDAWRRSQFGTPTAHEEGGWIFANSSNRIRIIHAPPGDADSMESLSRVPSLPGGGTSLLGMASGAVAQSGSIAEGWRLVATFHTHVGVEGQPIPGSRTGEIFLSPTLASGGDMGYSRNHGNISGIIRTQVDGKPYVGTYSSKPGPQNPCPR